jgi:uncharacterized protein (TIGR03086 family)
VTLDPLSALDAATRDFRRQLADIGPKDWTSATPCTAWDVRYLVAHVVGGNRFASMVLGGRTAVEAIEAVMGTAQLGTNPLADFDDSVSAMRIGFHRSGALDGLVSHPLGDLTGTRFLAMRVFDITLHAWDLATAIGAEARLEPRLVESVLETVRSEAAGMGFGIEPCGEAGPDASPLEQLLDLSGRCTAREPA